MPRTTRIRRPPNRQPTSLAGAANALSGNEAIDSIEGLDPDTNIDPALTTCDIDYPPPPSPHSRSHNSPDLNHDIYDYPTYFEHPSPSPALPDEYQSREASWPLTPPLASAIPHSQPASPLPLPFINDIQP